MRLQDNKAPSNYKWYFLNQIFENLSCELLLTGLLCKDWFDDKSINGFKIDGPALGAGNIPTGNGSEEIKNHFMVTPDELLERYKYVLENPTEEAM